MQLTQYTDYSLRVLIYLSLKRPDELATITDISEFYGISRNHLVKVVHNLSTHELIVTLRGKHGGLRLARPASDISIGEVVRLTESNFDIAECFNREANRCVITPMCALKNILGEARSLFMQELDRFSIADAVNQKNPLFKKIQMKLSSAHNNKADVMK